MQNVLNINEKLCRKMKKNAEFLLKAFNKFDDKLKKKRIKLN